MKETQQEKTDRIVRERILNIADKALSATQVWFMREVEITIYQPVGISEAVFFGKNTYR